MPLDDVPFALAGVAAVGIGQLAAVAYRFGNARSCRPALDRGLGLRAW